MPIYKDNASRYTYHMCYTTYCMYDAPRYTYYKYNASQNKYNASQNKYSDSRK